MASFVLFFLGCAGPKQASATPQEKNDPYYQQALFENKQLLPEVLGVVVGKYVNPQDKNEYVTLNRNGTSQYYGRVKDVNGKVGNTYFLAKGAWHASFGLDFSEANQRLALERGRMGDFLLP